MFVQVAASADVWIWYDLPDAVSHARTTFVILVLAPRSTKTHCGSTPCALSHRVPVALLSKAFAQACKALDAVHGRFSATFVPPAEVGVAVGRVVAVAVDVDVDVAVAPVVGVAVARVVAV